MSLRLLAEFRRVDAAFVNFSCKWYIYKRQNTKRGDVNITLSLFGQVEVSPARGQVRCAVEYSLLVSGNEPSIRTAPAATVMSRPNPHVYSDSVDDEGVQEAYNTEDMKGDSQNVSAQNIKLGPKNLAPYVRG